MPDFLQWRPWMAILFLAVGLITGHWFLMAAGILFFTWSRRSDPCILCRAGFCKEDTSA